MQFASAVDDTVIQHKQLNIRLNTQCSL